MPDHPVAHKNPPADPQLLSMQYEEAMGELKELINAMEGGELSLEQSMQYFERGRDLVAHCQRILDEAQLKIEEISLTNQADEEQ